MVAEDGAADPPCSSPACVRFLLPLSLFSASTSPKVTSHRKAASSSQWNTTLSSALPKETESTSRHFSHSSNTG